MRLFLAILLPPEVCLWASQIQAELRRRCPAKASWTSQGNLHVTLKFLGEVAQTQVAKLCDALGQVEFGQPMRLKLGEVECLPPHGRVHVIALGIAGEVERLANLSRDIEARCQPLGFPTERRAFRPHVTLARVKSPLRAAEIPRPENLPPPPEFVAPSFALMQSILNSAGATHHPLATFSLT